MTMTNRLRQATQLDPRQALIGWAIALGVWISQVMSGHLTAMDHAIADALAPLRSPTFDCVMKPLTKLGGSVGSLLILAGLLAWMWKRKEKRAAWNVAGAYLFGSLLVVVLKGLVNQWRPEMNPLASPLGLHARLRVAGFPSGHAFRAALLGGWLLPRLPDSPWLTMQTTVTILMISLIGLSRMYLQRHWASDVIGGWLVALVVLSLVRCWMVQAPHPKSQTNSNIQAPSTK